MVGSYTVDDHDETCWLKGIDELIVDCLHQSQSQNNSDITTECNEGDKSLVK